MKKILLIWGAASVLAIAASLAASKPMAAQLSASDPSARPIRAVMATVARNVLNFRHETPLSDGQKQQIASILSNHRTEIRSQVGRSHEARRAMLEAVDQAGPTSPAASAAAAKIGEAARDRALLIARVGSEIKPVLTPEQLNRVRAALQEVEAAVDSALAK